MKVAVCEDTDWLLSEEAYSIYAPCMYHPTSRTIRKQMEGFLQASSGESICNVKIKTGKPA